MSVEIIGEVGVTHEGHLPTALSMVEVAKKSGADAVKFQTFTAEKTLRKTDPDFNIIKKHELSKGSFKLIAKHCDDVGIEFMSTPDHPDDLKFLVEEIGVKRIKIGSADLLNRPLREAAYNSKLPVLLSTGMSNINEVWAALPSSDTYTDVTLMHCVSLYPTPFENTNLKAIKALQALGFPVGFSDHTIGCTASELAIALGATVIEKHICPNGYGGLDKEVSMIPFEFGQFVKHLRLVEKALGSGNKEPTEGELKFIKRLRKGPDGLRGIDGSDLFSMY
jgi:N,N'-diacetyllegionaminate synthase